MLHKGLKLTCCLFLLFAALIISAEEKAKGKGMKATGTKPVKATKPYRKLFALCIGINDYSFPDIPDLSYAENDAKEVAEILKKDYGFDYVTLLIGKNATREKIIDALADLQDSSKVKKEDGVIIYFSGHGVTVKVNNGEQGYLLPIDSKVSLKNINNPAPFRRSALRMDSLKDDADAIPAKHVLFLVDACYSGYMSSKAVSLAPEIENALSYNARQVITAGTQGEQAVEHHAWKHGAFTYKLLEKLSHEAKPVSASSLGIWLKRSVPREVAARAPEFKLSPQVKYLSGSGDFYFIRENFNFKPTTIQSIEEAKRKKIPIEYLKKVWEAEKLLNELERN